MATIKINYGGTIYSMVKTSSKITTPSVAVDGGYIPCFSGGRFAQVLVGNTLYTLSPIMVNGVRLACGVQTAFYGTAYINCPYKVTKTSTGSNHYKYTASTNGTPTGSTNQSGYICNVNISTYDVYGTFTTHASGNIPLDVTFKVQGTYSIVNTAFNKVVKTGSININKEIEKELFATTYTEKFAI